MTGSHCVWSGDCNTIAVSNEGSKYHSYYMIESLECSGSGQNATLIAQECTGCFKRSIFEFTAPLSYLFASFSRQQHVSSCGTSHHQHMTDSTPYHRVDIPRRQPGRIC